MHFFQSSELVMTCTQLRLIAKACSVTLVTPNVTFRGRRCLGVNHFSDTIKISNAKLWMVMFMIYCMAYII